jgi:hypothetical protein
LPSLEKAGGPLEAPGPRGRHEEAGLVVVELIITASIGEPTMLKSSSFVFTLFQLLVLEADDVVVEKVGIAAAAAPPAAVEVAEAGGGGAVIGTLLRGFLRAVLSEVLDSLSNLDHEGRSAGMIMTLEFLQATKVSKHCVSVKD